MAFFVAKPSGQTAALKVLISVDMEGVAGTVTGDQLGPAGFEYGRFREFMTREALAAVNAAKAAGATHWKPAPTPVFDSVASWQFVQSHGNSPPWLP